MRKTSLLVLPLSLAVVPFLGCDSFRSETRLHEDGRVERAIYQPTESLPLAAKEPQRWKAVTYSFQIDDSEWEGPISALPINEDSELSYFAAWGEFDSVDDIPDHYLKRSPDGKAKGELIRKAVRIDYVLVMKYEWNETLTDIVSLQDMQEAQRELTDLGIKMLRDIFEEALGPEYDFSDLET